MESFLDTIWNRNLYIGIPLGAFCCSLFLLFCFFHTMRNRTIRGLRLVLTACLIWTGSVSLMRLGIFPGITFWHNFALLGLLSIPVFMYVFLFGFLEITDSIEAAMEAHRVIPNPSVSEILETEASVREFLNQRSKF